MPNGWNFTSGKTCSKENEHVKIWLKIKEFPTGIILSLVKLK